MTRVRWIALIFLVAFATYLGAVGVVWLTRPTPGLTVENARLLRRGMTLEQVEQLFGSQVERFECCGWARKVPNRGETTCCEWSSENEPLLFVLVVFDNSDTLIGASVAGDGPYF